MRYNKSKYSQIVQKCLFANKRKTNDFQLFALQIQISPNTPLHPQILKFSNFYGIRGNQISNLDQELPVEGKDFNYPLM